MGISRKDFEALVERLKVDNPHWFQLDSDPPATDAEIAAAEASLMASLPEDYQFFLRRFGGGYFAFACIFSVRPASEWSLVAMNDEGRRLFGQEFLAVSENGVGDYYGFAVADHKCDSRVMFWDHETGTISETFPGFLEFLVSVALTS